MRLEVSRPIRRSMQQRPLNGPAGIREFDT
jgi:hypothetical protein